MFNFLKNLISNKTNLPTGALIDERKPEEKKNDINFKDIVATANAPVWTAKTSYRTFPAANQNHSYECGAFSLGKALGIMYAQYPQYGDYIEFSRSDIYQRRFNRPGEGMSLPDMFKIAGEGVTLKLLTKEVINYDADSDNLIIPTWMRTVGNQFAITGAGVYVDNNIDTLASIIQTTGKGIILMFYFISEEWGRQMPVILNPNLGLYDPSALKHFVVATDTTLKDNKRCLVIEDSAFFGGLNQRLITEDFLVKRCVQAAYPMNFKFSPNVGGRPSYDGQTIISAQQCLRWAGYFPSNVSYFENVGPTTRIALGKFQTVNGLTVTQALDGDTKNKLHQLFP